LRKGLILNRPAGCLRPTCPTGCHDQLHCIQFRVQLL